MLSQGVPLSCMGCPLFPGCTSPHPCALLHASLSSHSSDSPLSVQMQFGFWLLRYICTFMLFILGMKAPGLPHKPYMLLVNEERDVENSQVSPRAGAV